MESIDKVPCSNGTRLPVIMNFFGTLLERGECYRLGDINFAVTDIEQDTNSVKGAVILESKIDQSVKIVMTIEKKIQPTKLCLDRKDRDILRSLGLMNKTVQQELLSSFSAAVNGCLSLEERSTCCSCFKEPLPTFQPRCVFF